MHQPIASHDSHHDSRAPNNVPLAPPARYWQSPKPAGERCALSLLPLQCDEFAELPPTIEWGAKRFHAPCINFWVHNVKPDPPDA